jgi:hypothetical protein
MVNLMTEQEVSKRLNVSVASLRRRRLTKRGPAFHKVGSLVRYQPDDLYVWIVSLPPVNKAASLMGRRSAEARVKKWGKREFVKRMREWASWAAA